MTPSFCKLLLLRLNEPVSHSSASYLVAALANCAAKGTYWRAGELILDQSLHFRPTPHGFLTLVSATCHCSCAGFFTVLLVDCVHTCPGAFALAVPSAWDPSPPGICLVVS